MNNHLVRFFAIEKVTRLKELQRRLDILNAPRKDYGGDSFNPSHMVWLKEKPIN